MKVRKYKIVCSLEGEAEKREEREEISAEEVSEVRSGGWLMQLSAGEIKGPG